MTNRHGEQFDRGGTFSGVDFETGLQAADALTQGLPVGVTLAQFALRWILMFDAVSCAIPGAKNPEQEEDNVRAADLPPLSAEQMHTVREVYDRYPQLEAMIRAYGHEQGLADLQQAAQRWEAQIYRPVAQQIRARRLSQRFPGERSADVFVRAATCQEEARTAGGTPAHPPSGRCACCGRCVTDQDRIEVDHIVPRSLGGSHDPTNRRLPHRPCHDQRGIHDKDRTTEEPEEVNISCPVL